VIITKIVGLTGGIATGKSTVSSLLKDWGAEVIDADLVARAVVEPGQLAWQEIRRSFGDEFFQEDGTINRAKLGALVFKDKDALAKLNKITHPKIAERIKEAIIYWQGVDHQPPLLVVDAPLLIETNLQVLVEEVWLVTCNEKEQIRRLMARNNLSHTDALARIKAQMPLEEKKKYADQVIDNSGSIEETQRQVASLWEKTLHWSGNFNV